MILDELLQLSDSQAETSTAISDNIIDLGAVDRNIGTGEPMAVVFNVEVAALVSDTDETYVFTVEVDSAATMDTAEKAIASISFSAAADPYPALPASLLAAGYVFALNIPLGGLAEAERYLAARYTLGGTTPGLTVSAHLVPLSGIPKNVDYPKGYTIS